MKGKTRRLLVLALAVALFAALVPVAGLAEGNKTYFAGEECLAADLNPGIWEPLGNGKYRVTGMEQQFTDDTDDPRTTGDTYIVVNAILDPNTFSGPMHSTFEIVNDQGSWSGHWVGQLDYGASSIHAVGHGGGAYEGLVGYWTYNRPDPGACFLIDGYIVETGGGD